MPSTFVDDVEGEDDPMTDECSSQYQQLSEAIRTEFLGELRRLQPNVENGGSTPTLSNQTSDHRESSGDPRPSAGIVPDTADHDMTPLEVGNSSQYRFQEMSVSTTQTPIAPGSQFFQMSNQNYLPTAPRSQISQISTTQMPPTFPTASWSQYSQMSNPAMTSQWSQPLDVTGAQQSAEHILRNVSMPGPTWVPTPQVAIPDSGIMWTTPAPQMSDFAGVWAHSSTAGTLAPHVPGPAATGASVAQLGSPNSGSTLATTVPQVSSPTGAWTYSSPALTAPSPQIPGPAAAGRLVSQQGSLNSGATGTWGHSSAAWTAPAPHIPGSAAAGSFVAQMSSPSSSTTRTTSAPQGSSPTGPHSSWPTPTPQVYSPAAAGTFVPQMSSPSSCTTRTTSAPQVSSPSWSTPTPQVFSPAAAGTFASHMSPPSLGTTRTTSALQVPSPSWSTPTPQVFSSAAARTFASHMSPPSLGTTRTTYDLQVPSPSWSTPTPQVFSPAAAGTFASHMSSPSSGTSRTTSAPQVSSPTGPHSSWPTPTPQVFSPAAAGTFASHMSSPSSGTTSSPSWSTPTPQVSSPAAAGTVVPQTSFPRSDTTRTTQSVLQNSGGSSATTTPQVSEATLWQQASAIANAPMSGYDVTWSPTAQTFNPYVSMPSPSNTWPPIQTSAPTVASQPYGTTSISTPNATWQPSSQLPDSAATVQRSPRVSTNTTWPPVQMSAPAVAQPSMSNPNVTWQPSQTPDPAATVQRSPRISMTSSSETPIHLLAQNVTQTVVPCATDHQGSLRDAGSDPVATGLPRHIPHSTAAAGPSGSARSQNNTSIPSPLPSSTTKLEALLNWVPSFDEPQYQIGLPLPELPEHIQSVILLAILFFHRDLCEHDLFPERRGGMKRSLAMAALSEAAVKSGLFHTTLQKEYLFRNQKHFTDMVYDSRNEFRESGLKVARDVVPEKYNLKRQKGNILSRKGWNEDGFGHDYAHSAIKEFVHRFFYGDAEKVGRENPHLFRLIVPFTILAFTAVVIKHALSEYHSGSGYKQRRIDVKEWIAAYTLEMDNLVRIFADPDRREEMINMLVSWAVEFNDVLIDPETLEKKEAVATKV